MTIQIWRKKHDPELKVEAVQLSADNASGLVHWCEGFPVEELDPTNGNKHVGINVPTFAGKDRASEGDYVIKDVELGFIVCKPGLFEMMFERIS